MRLEMPVTNGVKLILTSRNNLLRIDCNFSPSRYPAFAEYLDSHYRLMRLHNNEDNTGYYYVCFKDSQLKSIITDLHQAAKDHIDINNPAPAYVPAKNKKPIHKHRWEILQPTPKIATVYKATICKRCKCVRLHKFAGNTFSKTYLIDGKEITVRPECSATL